MSSSGEIIHRDARLDDLRAVIGEGLSGGGVADGDDGLHCGFLPLFDKSIIPHTGTFVNPFFANSLCKLYVNLPAGQIALVR